MTNTGAAAAKQFGLPHPASAFEALRGGSFDVVSMANNHGMIDGESGLERLWRRSATASRSGSGSTASAPTLPYRRTVRGQRVAILAVTQVLDDHLISSWSAGPGLRPRLRKERAAAVAGGAPGRPERRHRGRLPALGRRFRGLLDLRPAHARADAGARGADIVVGGHAHRLLGGGRMGDAFVDYGLGNFVWYGTSEPLDADWRVLRDRDRPPHRLLPLGARAHRRRRPEATGRRGGGGRRRHRGAVYRLHRAHASSGPSPSVRRRARTC